MDSGGILCLHYPFCSSITMGAGMGDTADAYQSL